MGFFVGLCFGMHYSVSFLVFQSLDAEESCLLCFYCLSDLVPVNVLWLLLMVPLVGLQYVIVVFPNHTHLIFDIDKF